MARSPGVELALAAAFLTLVPAVGAGQGGWRQWDLVLLDGTTLVANPLGAPNNQRFTLSIGDFESPSGGIPRRRVDYLAAATTVGPRREPVPGPALPPAPVGRVCQDLVIRRDGRRTSGPITLTRVIFSEGVIRQGGHEIDLAEVAYLKFAHGPETGCRLTRRTRSGEALRVN